MSHSTSTHAALTETERRLLRSEVDEAGEVRTARRHEVSRSTILRAVSGLPLQRRTLAQLRLRLGASAPAEVTRYARAGTGDAP